MAAAGLRRRARPRRRFPGECPTRAHHGALAGASRVPADTPGRARSTPRRAASLLPTAARSAADGRAGDSGPAGVHQPGGAGGDRGAATVRHPGRGDDRPGHRRIGVGAERARRRQTTTCSGSRGPGRPAVTCCDTGVRERCLGHPHRPVPRLPQHRGEHRGPQPAAGTGPAYQHAMASRDLPDAFATALTGVYATDPGYGSNLIALMRLYNLYRYDSGDAAAAAAGAAAGGARRRGRPPGVGPRASRRWCRASLTRGVRRAGQAFRGGRGRGRGAGGAGDRATRTGARTASRAGGAQRQAAGRAWAGTRDRDRDRDRGSRRGVRCRNHAAMSPGFRTRSPPTSRRRPRAR